MKIISVNAGSSSLKFTLFNMEDESVIASGVFERIGLDGSKYTIKYNGDKIMEELDIPNHTEAVKILLDKLISLDISKNKIMDEGLIFITDQLKDFPNLYSLNISFCNFEFQGFQGLNSLFGYQCPICRML